MLRIYPVPPMLLLCGAKGSLIVKKSVLQDGTILS